MTKNGWTLVAVGLATFMTYLDNNIVNVAIPDIQRELGLSTAGIEWVVSGYILTFAGLLLAGGRLADAFGRRRLFLIGLAVFTGSSLLAGFAGGETGLIAARALQGVGAALVTPTTLAIISATFTDPRRAERGRGRLGRGRRAGAGGRPRAGRAAHPARVLGVDLLDQRPGRDRDHGARRLGHHGVPGARGASSRPGRAHAVDGVAVRPDLGPDRGPRPRLDLGRHPRRLRCRPPRPRSPSSSSSAGSPSRWSTSACSHGASSAAASWR